MNQQVKVKLLRENAKLPTYGTAGAAGADLYASNWITAEGTVIDFFGKGTNEVSIMIEPQSTVLIGTGIAMEIPVGKVGHVYARSGMACKKGLSPANKVGVIDNDYRGEIIVALYNHGKVPKLVELGDKIAQIEIVDIEQYDFIASEELSNTVRDKDGFNSTGTK